MDVKAFKDLPLMGIVRGIDVSCAGPLAEECVKAGLRALEITMNTPAAAEIIKETVSAAAGRMDIGAGTVLSAEDLDVAARAGATFIVSPVTDPALIRTCGEKGLPVFPGAMTPTEVLTAWRCGATMVKLFPAFSLGPGYFKALKGPFGAVELMAVGGVRLENIREFFASGADAIAFGAGVIKKEWLAAGDFRSIGDLVADYVKEVRSSVER